MINVCGLFGGHLGLGQAARNCVTALESAGVDTSVINYPPLPKPRRLEPEWNNHGSLHPLTLFVCNPDIYNNVEASTPVSGKRLALWFWELENLPSKWLPFIKRFEQIWCPSRFIFNAVSKHTDKARLVPLAVDIVADPDRKRFKIPLSCFTVLTMFDGNSTIERKNPYAAIEAFTRADIPNAWLVVKAQNLSSMRLAQLKKKLKQIPYHRLIVGPRPRWEVNALLSSCDCLLSMHRSEGFGLPLAETMALGRVAIGTRYGGNVDFMSAMNSMLVDYKLVDTPRVDIAGQPHVYSGQQWAEPSIDDAIDKLRTVADSPSLRKKLSRNALKTMSRLRYKPVGMFYKESLKHV